MSGQFSLPAEVPGQASFSVPAAAPGAGNQKGSKHSH